jgi:hypothetical protein
MVLMGQLSLGKIHFEGESQNPDVFPLKQPQGFQLPFVAGPLLAPRRPLQKMGGKVEIREELCWARLVAPL